MIRTFSLSVCALAALAFCSCASHHDDKQPPGNETYQPENKAERTELRRDRVDIYPEDVRTNLDAYTNQGVAWVGYIQSTDAQEEDQGGKISAYTVFEHRYFNWVQNSNGKKTKLFISPRGEGLFRTHWHLNKTGDFATAESAQKYAGEGKMAIVYGLPERIDADGGVVLKYRYLRLLNSDEYSTNEFDYGRFGSPMHKIEPGPGILSLH